MLIRKIEKNDC